VILLHCGRLIHICTSFYVTTTVFRLLFYITSLGQQPCGLEDAWCRFGFLSRVIGNGIPFALPPGGSWCDWPLPGCNVTDQHLLTVPSTPSDIFCIQLLYSSWDSAVIVIWLWAGRSGDRIPAWARNVPLYQKVQTGSGAHPASYSISTAVLFLEISGRGVKLTNRLHLMSRLTMCRAIPPIILHAVMVYVLFYLYFSTANSTRTEILYFRFPPYTAILKIV
jgi:hypothetical protein